MATNTKNLYLEDLQKYWSNFIDYFFEKRDLQYPLVYAESLARFNLFKYYRGKPSKKG